MGCLGTQMGRKEDKQTKKKGGKRTNKLMNNGVHRIETRLQVRQSEQRPRGGGGLTDTARMRTAGAAMTGLCYV